ncbi:hexokinase-4-like [Styela clava]
MESLLKSLDISDPTLHELTDAMRREMGRGLAAKTNEEAEIKMLPTYVTGTPDGTEDGEFLALDLGGTNFRILLVKIVAGENKNITMDSQIYHISQDLMTGTGTQLFDHLVDCLWDFLVKRGLMCQLLPIGFTFSFPTKHLGIDKTILLRWTKGYTASGVEGEDIGKLLNDAINKKFKIRCLNFDLKIMATVVNDTVGTMVSCGYDDNDTCMGMIVGTGTNMAYMEKQENIELLEKKTPASEMCINTEWGAFGDNSESLKAIRTEYDIEIDEKSPNKGHHIFEKMISGMYMGELVRLIILKLTSNREIFDGIAPDSILFNSGLSTAFVSHILNPNNDNNQIRQYLAGFGLIATDDDCNKLVQLCEAISKRAAYLCAAGVVAVARKIAENKGPDAKMTIGVDGSVYRKHPTFAKLLHAKVKDLGGDLKITFRESTDGSGRGAALVAAVECRLHKISTKVPEQTEE